MHTIYLYNSLTKQKEPFVPITPNALKMYVCGQTVYDYCHLGHARKAIVFDVIRRWFIASGYQVTFVENITDIDDKIIHRAQENHESIKALTDRFTGYMQQDFLSLNVLPADIAPRATDYVENMIVLITRLLESKHAYVAPNNDVYYAVNSYDGYGKLSGRDIKDLIVGLRVAVNADKSNPLDFVLWKAAKEGEPYWNAPFGKGRPGWHIECSAMAEALLGESFDIHGGGQDLLFPHHENEIAQSEALSEKKLANYWLHNGFLNIANDKMSKSLGNFLTIREALAKHNAETIRFFMLKTHYRSPLNYTDSILENARQSLTKFYLVIRKFPNNSTNYKNTVGKNNLQHIIASSGGELARRCIANFIAAMNDDFNTPLAISVLFELLHEINKLDSTNNIDFAGSDEHYATTQISQANALLQVLLTLGRSLGLFMQDANNYLTQQNVQQNGLLNISTGSTVTNEEIEHLIAKRHEARQAKNYKLADEIRQQLTDYGVTLEDTATDVTLWKR